MRILAATLFTVLIIFPQVALPKPTTDSERAKAIVAEVVESMGGIQGFRELKDVEYTYIYRDNANNKEDVSIERYIIDGEFSWARYTKHEKFVIPGETGPVVQGYDGKKTWLTVNGNQVSDPEAIKRADFLRKTNFYWFAMMFKLLDSGIIYSYEGKQEVNRVHYDKVKITFEPGVGDVSDTYLLYVNPSTNLVDQFLFTVMDFGKKDPYLMVVSYEEIQGVKLPARRKYTAADWQGNILNEQWVDEIMKDIQVNNGFEKQMFSAPLSS